MFRRIKPNIGILNALVRITAGFTMLSFCTIRALKRPYSDTNMLWIIIGAMKVAEGIVRFCPVTAIVQQTMQEDDQQEKDQAINPS
ncbi:YgaP family membrane protein [Thalassobacillus devorans]|uniref:YgaP family membrane protein n=1 Tax=Thalassobacillus devorans TaxID=279813 RepID=UPI0020CB3BB1|nr:DUF2892 domain-containing protein [Thalassobacillus devorans]